MAHKQTANHMRDPQTASTCAEIASNLDDYLSSFEPSKRSKVLEAIHRSCERFGFSHADLQHRIKQNRTDQNAHSAYPDPKRPDFAERLNQKREFRSNHLDFENTTIENICSDSAKPFSLLPYQRYLVNFMSPLTPYRGILVFHGVGTGKTATAISIAESFKSIIVKNPYNSQRRVLIMALNNSIEGTFRSTLHNNVLEEREAHYGMRKGSLHATGSTYFPDQVFDDKNRHDVESNKDIIRRKYESYYEIIGPDAFSKHINQIVRDVNDNVKQDKDLAIKKALCREYSNRLIIVDEVHNIKDKSYIGQPAYKAYEALREVLRNANNIRLVLMSATPMFNEPYEIINVLNLLIANDKGRELKTNEIFHESSNMQFKESGLAILRERAKPYISYVRGYNPVSFPSLLEVDDKRVAEKYSSNTLYLPKPTRTIEGDRIKKKDWMRHTKIIRCPMSYFQFENYIIISQSISGRKRNVAYKEEQDLCGFVYPLDAQNGAKSKEGFYSCFRAVNRNHPGGKTITAYRYQNHCRDFLKLPNLEKYSSKYAKILKNLFNTPGIAFVFFENIEVGVETMAMILDAHGYDKEESQGPDNYLLDHGVTLDQKRCSICNQIRSAAVHQQKGSANQMYHRFRQARYVVLQHQDSVSINSEIINRLKHPDNRYGEYIKIILGSPVTKESVDFANIRQIHLASAWFNMSKIAQIIGRGVRNCSHYLLKPEDRDVVVFRYSASPCPKTGIIRKDISTNGIETRRNLLSPSVFETETGDEYLWRTAEHKDIIIKKIERELKKIAFDCPANYQSNILKTDKTGSRECDYMQCTYQCISDSKAGRPRESMKQQRDFLIAEPRKTLDNTWTLQINSSDTENAKFYITKLFDTESALTFDEIKLNLKHIDYLRNDGRILALALEEMLGGNSSGLPEIVQKSSGVQGYLIYKGDVYAFQPLYVQDRRVPMRYRSQTAENVFPSINNTHRLLVSLPKFHSLKKSSSSTHHIIEQQTSLERILTEMNDPNKDIILKYRYLDTALTNDERVTFLEYIIENQAIYPQTEKMFLYYNNFIFFNSQGLAYGHFLTKIPRCLRGLPAHSKGWTPCTLQDIRRQEDIQATQYKEIDADFVGYMQIRESGRGSRFKIINNTGQRDKTRLDLEVALNTLTKGKTCSTYDRVILNSLAKKLDIKTSNVENKLSLCSKIEYALRERQLDFADGKRYFYNAIETSAWIQKNSDLL